MIRYLARARTLQLVLTASLALACDESEGDGEGNIQGSQDVDAGAHGGSACQPLNATQKAALFSGNDKLDLLFVIDNSGSMAQEQTKLAQQIPALLTSLANGQATDGTTFTPMRDMHVGVVTSDMGLSGSPIRLPPSCEGFGDDGILIKNATANAPDGYLSYTTEQGSLGQTLADLSVLANVGIAGCGFEQQLEAMYKALAPSSVKFAQDRPGNADGPNKGFLRPDATLAIVHLTDEEDCSVTSEGEALFDDNTNHPAVKLSGTEQRLGLNIRCAYAEPSVRISQVEAAGLVQSPERYVRDFKRNVKPGNPDGIVFIAIVGIPDGTEGLTPQEILADARMGFAVDPNTGAGDPTNRNTAARDACRRCADASTDCDAERVVTEEGVPNANIVTGAKPGVRFVKVAEGFGDNGLVQSICAESYAPALNHLVQKVARVAGTPPAEPTTGAGCTP